MRATRAHDILGYRTVIAADDPALDAYVARLYVAFPEITDPDHECRIHDVDNGTAELRVNDEVVGEHEHAEALIPTLVHHLNREVATACAHVLVHAGGLERNGIGLVLPAYMEHGKTTLTTGLVRVGFGYLTDEAVAIRRDTLEIVPYPKPLSIDEGSWPLFPELEPDAPLPTDGYKDTQWQVPPGDIRSDALGRPCRARFVVFPSYEEGARTELLALSRAEALVELTKNTFRFDQEGRPSLDVLAEVVRGAEVYRLPNGSLTEAVAVITELVERYK